MHTTHRSTPPRAARHRCGLAAVAALCTAVTLAAPPASAAPSAPTAPSADRVLAQGLNAPYGLSTTRGRALLVAESADGTVTRLGRSGRTRAVVRDAAGVSGVASRGRFVWSVIGGPSPEGPPVGGAYGPSTVLRTNLDTGRTRVIADLLDHEARRNPDGQVQLVDGAPVDALSNPFSMTWTPRGLLVADGGANAVLRVDPWSGRTSTFHVPPNPQTPECLAPDAQANPGTVGCDSVPTGVAYHRGSVYVSTLGSGAPGAGTVVKLSLGGRVQRVWDGLDGPTGVAASRRAVFYSQVFGGGGTGQVVRLDRSSGRERTLAVPQPTGLLFARGILHASTGSLTPGAGRVLTLPQRRFRG